MCLRQNYERRMYSSTRYRGTHMATPQLNQEGTEQLNRSAGNGAQRRFE